MPIYQVILLENNDDDETKVSVFHIGQKINSKKDVKQELPISHTDRKVSVRGEEHPASKAHKS